MKLYAAAYVMEKKSFTVIEDFDMAKKIGYFMIDFVAMKKNCMNFKLLFKKWNYEKNFV